MKKIIIAAIFFIILCLTLPKYAGDISLIVRGQMRRTLSKELAQYLVENDYRFPKNWEDCENYRRRQKYGDDYKPVAGSGLENKFSLPWGESLTNKNVSSSVWFRSLDRQRSSEDAVFTREVLFCVWAVSTNKDTIENIIKLWDKSQQREDRSAIEGTYRDKRTNGEAKTENVRRGE